MDASILIVGFGCFIAAFINAAFATGGVFIVLATLTLVFPPRSPSRSWGRHRPDHWLVVSRCSGR